MLPVLPGLLLLLCAGESSGSAGKSSLAEHHSRATGGSQPAHRPRTAKLEGVAASCWPRRRPRRHRQKHPANAGEPGTGTGHHDHRRQGCQGRRTATTERAPAPVAAPDSANAREQERRAAASNIPDSVSYFVSPNGPTTGPRREPAIAQASHNFMERRFPGGIRDCWTIGLLSPGIDFSRVRDR